MRPGSRRADAQDLFLAGRAAVVEAILFDVDGKVHLAVSPLETRSPICALHGRFLYFAPDEVEQAEADSGEDHHSGGPEPDIRSEVVMKWSAT